MPGSCWTSVASVLGGIWKHFTHSLPSSFLLRKDRCASSSCGAKLDPVSAAGVGTQSGADHWKVQNCWAS